MIRKNYFARRVATWVFQLLCVAYVHAQAVQSLSDLQFHSSNSTLNDSFNWAKRQALAYARTGTIGAWYEAALPGRNAFCMRDVSHQTQGAAALGLFAANRNMLSRFAASAAPSRDWAAFWEIDRNGGPSTFDYVSDDDFWFNLPANFDLLDAAVRMWRWTGDPAYRSDPQLQRFFRATLTDYIEQWQLHPGSILARQRILNRKLSRGRFVDSRGIPSYSEGAKDFTVGADLLASEYRAIRSYSEIAVGPDDEALSARMQGTADQLESILEQVMWNPQERHFYGRIRADQTGAGSGDTLVLYFEAAKDTDRIRGALDYIANPRYWGQINIEEESYIPIVLFRYVRPTDAYKVLFDMTRSDKPRREYPEVSYAAVAAIVSGAMGIEPSDSGDNFDVRTLAQPPASADDLVLTSLQIRNNTLDIKHIGTTATSIVNRQGPALLWKAEFSGLCGRVRVNGKSVHGTDESLPGGAPVCSVIVTVPSSSSAAATMR